MEPTDRCDDDVYQNGNCVLMVTTPRSHTLEDWRLLVQEESGQRFDWSQFGGRAVFRYLGDRVAVEAAIVRLIPRLEEMYLACTDNFASPPFKASDVMISWMSDGGALGGPVASSARGMLYP